MNKHTDNYHLKKAIEEILYNTETAGNGGYIVHLGPVLFSTLIKLTKYDISKRRICQLIDNTKIKE
ncbi:MAG: hypothetical protein A2Y71_10230 [Bacteroidetes bacterium RBG_13_42_15]|nr:MAG: hypothetical protein A2Y71_10230 [Bacteroidetes bacterium RBG_13_42_15]